MKTLFTFAALLWIIGGLTFAEAPSTPPTAEQALMEAAYHGKLDAIQRLVSEGTAVDAVDAEKHTSLMWAAFNGHTAVVEYLLEKRASVNAKDENGRTALMYAASGPFEDTVALLLKKGAEVNVQGKLEGFTALMTASAEGQIDVVRVLLAHGADREIKDKDGDTAASFARQKGHWTVVALLEGEESE